MAKTALTRAEKSRLSKLEDNIQSNMELAERAFVALGAAYQVIRDERLYKESFSSFAEYCKETWGLNVRYVNRMISAAEVANEIGPNGPRTERQSRPLTQIPQGERQQFWTALLEAHPTPTAKVIQESVSRYNQDPVWKTPAVIELRKDDPYPAPEVLAKVEPDTLTKRQGTMFRLPRTELERWHQLHKNHDHLTGNDFIVFLTNYWIERERLDERPFLKIAEFVAIREEGVQNKILEARSATVRVRKARKEALSELDGA